MPSYIKAAFHTLLTYLAIVVMTYLPHYFAVHPIFQESFGAVLLLALNFAVSHFIPTTSGASAHQG